MTVLYGIKNCDTVKKARRWLEENGNDYQFHDFREDGLNQSLVSQWIEQIGQDQLVNRRSTTWKQLSDHDKEMIESKNKQNTIGLLCANPTLIKRPVVEHNQKTIVGFKNDEYSKIFN